MSVSFIPVLEEECVYGNRKARNPFESQISSCVCRFLSRAVPDFVQVTLNRICAVLSPVEFGALEQGGAKMAALTPEELKKMKDDGR